MKDNEVLNYIILSGVVQAVQNLGLATIPLFVGWILENYGYRQLEFFNVAMLGAAILGTFALLWSSKVSHMGYLHMTTKTRDHFETTQEYYDMMKKVSGESRAAAHQEHLINGTTGIDNPNYRAYFLLVNLDVVIFP